MNYRAAIILIASVFLAGPAFAGDGRRELWLYYPTNLLVDKNVDELEKIWHRAAVAGYSKVLLADSKMAKLGDLESNQRHYFANIERVKAIAALEKLAIVPAVFAIGYSNSLLWHDPNLAEGLPVKGSLFVVKNGEGRLVADPPVTLGRMSWKDDAVAVEGGIATLKNPAGNARFVYKLNLPKYRSYHVSVKIKTQGFAGEARIQALADGRSLQYTNLRIEATQEWKEQHVVFNTLDHEQVNLYFGVWGGAKGILQWKEWRIEEVGLLNVLRRPGTPCVVEGYVEGKDYERIEDPLMGRKPWKGEYETYHAPPVIKTHLPDGTRLRVSWYHPAIIYDEQVSCCPSEARTMELLADEAKRVKAALGAAGYMMSHDEIRTLNWCEACQKRKLEAGAILAENVRSCTEYLKGSTVYVWSDMFDPHHNAVKDYYLVRGDLRGSWEGLGREVVVVNWNFGKRDESLKFFADRGNRQVIAGYYDGPVGQVGEWLKSADRVKGVVGIMYTTWRHQYDDLEAFAKACGQ